MCNQDPGDVFAQPRVNHPLLQGFQDWGRSSKKRNDHISHLGKRNIIFKSAFTWGYVSSLETLWFLVGFLDFLGFLGWWQMGTWSFPLGKPHFSFASFPRFGATDAWSWCFNGPAIGILCLFLSPNYGTLLTSKYRMLGIDTTKQPLELK